MDLDAGTLSDDLVENVKFINQSAIDHVVARHGDEGLIRHFAAEYPLFYTVSFINSVIRKVNLQEDFDHFLKTCIKGFRESFSMTEVEAAELTKKAMQLTTNVTLAEQESVWGVLARTAARHADNFAPGEIQREQLDSYVMILLSGSAYIGGDTPYTETDSENIVHKIDNPLTDEYLASVGREAIDGGMSGIEAVAEFQARMKEKVASGQQISAEDRMELDRINKEFFGDNS
jgi:hypothetical protein